MNLPKIGLNRIFSWANVLSWVMLAVQVTYFVGGIIIKIQSGGLALRTNLFSMMFALSPLVSGAGFFIIPHTGNYVDCRTAILYLFWYR